MSSRDRWSAARTTPTSRQTPTKLHASAILVVLALAVPAAAQTRADILRGEYGRYRSNNDLLSYRLDIRVDPAKQFLSGRNTIRFRMLQDDSRIQIDLYAFW